MIDKYKDKYFRKYFCYGIDDKESVLERIIYESMKESHNVYGDLKNLYSVPNNIQLNKLKEFAIRHYKQFYRFVILNDNYENFDYKTENEDEIVKDVINRKVNTLISNKEIEESAVGYFFTREAEDKFIKAEEDYKKGNLDNGWTCAVFYSLKRLENLEKEEITLYQIKWLKAKMARAITRQPHVQDEMQELLKICKSEKEVSNITRLLHDSGKEIGD